MAVANRASNLQKEAEEVFRLIDEERHLVALELLEKVQERIDQQLQTPRRLLVPKKKQKEDEIYKVQRFLAQREVTLNKLRNRCRLFRQALANVDESTEWKEASHYLGVTTYYRREADMSLSIKLQGTLQDAPLFEQICVLREFDLHSQWSPCCTSSQTIATLDRLDIVGWFMVGLPSYGVARDGCVRVIGCDSAKEDGKLILAGQGVADRQQGQAPPLEETFLVDDPIIDTLDIPDVPNKRGTGRMTIRTFQAIIEVNSPTSATTTIVTNLNPNISILPNWLLEFAMKNIAGALLWKMQGAASRMVQNPITNPHARRMRQDAKFYKDWLLPKCQDLCALHGWEMTPVHYFDDLPPQRSEQRPMGIDDGCCSSTVGVLSTQSVDMMEGNESLSSDFSKDGSLSSMGRQLLRHARFSKFLKKEERKTKLRKAVKQTEQLAKSTQRLVARSLSQEEELRFQALQRVKHRQGAPSSVSQRVSQSLHDHTPRTRGCVMTVLMTALFLALYPSLFLYAGGWTAATVPWRHYLSANMEAIVCIFLCATPHFLLCDVALIYAVDSLELGSKMGHQVKTFYSDTVRYMMMLLSVGIAVVSVTKAAVKVGIVHVGGRVAQVVLEQEDDATWFWTTSKRLASGWIVGDKSTPSWTLDAYHTARIFYLYTSVFLVLVVVFFSLSLGMRSSKSEAQPPRGRLLTGTSSSNSMTVSSS